MTVRPFTFEPELVLEILKDKTSECLPCSDWLEEANTPLINAATREEQRRCSEEVLHRFEERYNDNLDNKKVIHGSNCFVKRWHELQS